MSILSVISAFALQAAPPALPDTARMTCNQVSKDMGLYVYPSKGHSQQQQKGDEFECHKWAVSQSGKLMMIRANSDYKIEHGKIVKTITLYNEADALRQMGFQYVAPQ